MSYDVYLEAPPCDHCQRAGAEPDLPDPTYNLTPIFDLALSGEGLPNAEVSEVAMVLMGAATDRPRGLRLLSGKTGAESMALLNAALDRMGDERFRPRFLELQPSNGWGDFAGALRVMTTLRRAAEEYPTNIWRVH